MFTPELLELIRNCGFDRSLVDKAMEEFKIESSLLRKALDDRSTLIKTVDTALQDYSEFAPFSYGVFTFKKNPEDQRANSPRYYLYVTIESKEYRFLNAPLKFKNLHFHELGDFVQAFKDHIKI